MKYYKILKRLKLLSFLKSKVYKMNQIKNAISDLKNGKIVRPIIKCS